MTALFELPVLSVVKARTNGPLIAAAARLWIGPEDLVVDVTYGRGNFWTDYRPEHLTPHDIALDGVDFRELPEADGSTDVVVFDPPYIPQGGRETSTAPEFLARYGLLTVARSTGEMEEVNRRGVAECARILRPGGRLFVKCCDYVNGGEFVQGRHTMVESARAAGLKQVDEFVHSSGTGPQPSANRDGTPRRQLHSRRAHSFLCIFQKRQR